MTAREISLPEFHAEVAQAAQKVGGIENVKFRCVMCKCEQSAADLIAAGAGADFAAVEGYVAFSCVGRWTGAGSPRKEPDGEPCNWTLGGLFNFSELLIIGSDGTKYPRFELAEKADGREYENRVGGSHV